MFEKDGRCWTKRKIFKGRKGDYSLRMESGVKKISSLRLIASGRILRRSKRSSIDYRMAWLNMREWKKILRNILMLWYIKKRVLMLMLIRETIHHSKACGNAEICQISVHNLRKHMVKTRYEFNF